ncbi:MAG TPA: Fur family transcriptional regulator [Candidatus Paceibacterota bacterium]|nr:Fur family transcriptional regulator [Candidatus Paceibacterota bacterium]
MKKQMQPIDVESLLQDNGFKRTPLRIALLEALANSSAPLSVAQLVRKTKKLGADTATLYRALNAFEEEGLVHALNVDKTKVLYEIVRPKTHLHHIMCDSCNAVESVAFCVKSLNQQVVKQSRQFKKIHSHQLAFVGTCRKCLRAVR